MATNGLASAPHPPANRGGAVGGAAAASPEPPGLRRPETPAPGRLPQMAGGRGRRRRPCHRPGGAGAVYCAAP